MPPTAVPSRSSLQASGARLRMADLASLAGCSVSTVSRALSGDPKVKQSTRERIGELAGVMHYTVHEAAKNLRLRQCKTASVAVVVPDESRQLGDGRTLALVCAIADALAHRGLDMLLSVVSSHRINTAAQAFDNGRAFGLVMIDKRPRIAEDEDQISLLAARQVPLVVWRPQPALTGCCTFDFDHELAGQQATAHLLKLGRRHIAFVGDATAPAVAPLFEGYLRAHIQAGCLATPGHLPWDVGLDVARHNDLFDGQPTLDGVVAQDDQTAMAVIAALKRLGRRVPEDVAVVGHGNTSMAETQVPSLTSVALPIGMAGQRLVEALCDQAAGLTPESASLPTRLVCRDSSSGPLAVRRRRADESA